MIIVTDGLMMAVHSEHARHTSQQTICNEYSEFSNLRFLQR